MSTDKDGLGKNIDKLKTEYKRLREGMSPHWRRIKDNPDSHAYVNLWVEAQRISPYLMGHIDAVLYPILVAIILYQLIWG